MANIVTKRFIECQQLLVEKRVVRSSRHFVLELGYSPQSWSKVLKEERDVTIELIRKGIDRFGLNPAYLFSGQGDPLMDVSDFYTANVLAVAVDPENNERIVHVPVAAQAGYLDQYNDPLFISDLSSFSLPGVEFKHGTYRAFDVSGDSMEPSIFQGDMVVCNYMDPDLWTFNIRSDYVYVIVTLGDIVIKRVQNNLRTRGTLTLCSDNSFYEPYEIPGNEIRELWFVKMKVSPFAHSQLNNRINMENEFDDMRSVISSQSAMIENLNKTIEKLLKRERISH